MTSVHLLVGVADERYALHVSDVAEVAQIGEITPLPGAARTVLGVRNLRGRLLPVLDLAALLDIERRGRPSALAVVERAGHQVGLAVDTLLGTAELSSRPEPGDEEGPVRGAAMIDGGLVGILDVAALLDASRGTPR